MSTLEEGANDDEGSLGAECVLDDDVPVVLVSTPNAAAADEVDGATVALDAAAEVGVAIVVE